MSYQFVKSGNINYIYSGDTANSGSKAELRISSWGGVDTLLTLSSTGTLAVPNITAGNITAGNVNVVGDIYKNGVSVRSSQWDNGTNSIFYTVGNVGIGTTSPAYKLHVTGDIYTTGDVVTFSDVRLKSNVQTITDALDKVSNMRGVYFDVDNHPTSTRKIGVIAQEMKTVIPEVVTSPDNTNNNIEGNNENNYLGVAYGNLVGVLIEAIKELNESNKELRSRIQRLEELN